MAVLLVQLGEQVVGVAGQGCPRQSCCSHRRTVVRTGVAGFKQASSKWGTQHTFTCAVWSRAGVLGLVSPVCGQRRLLAFQLSHSGATIV